MLLFERGLHGTYRCATVLRQDAVEDLQLLRADEVFINNGVVAVAIGIGGHVAVVLGQHLQIAADLRELHFYLGNRLVAGLPGFGQIGLGKRERLADLVAAGDLVDLIKAQIEKFHALLFQLGMLIGVNVAATAALARAVRLPVIASGGVAGVEDIVALRAAGAGIEGAILGRALYDGRIEPKLALKAAA
mgnify:CR=1 FL=1